MRGVQPRNRTPLCIGGAQLATVRCAEGTERGDTVKNIIISILAALLTVEYVPWFAVCTVPEKIGVMIGVGIPLIIFCFFLDFWAEKYRKWRARVRKVRRAVERLQRRNAT